MTAPVIDLAAVGPCPNCGAPTRRLASTPIKGTGLDARPADAAWCTACLQAKCVAAADQVRAATPSEVALTGPDQPPRRREARCGIPTGPVNRAAEGTHHSTADARAERPPVGATSAALSP